MNEHKLLNFTVAQACAILVSVMTNITASRIAASDRFSGRGARCLWRARIAENSGAKWDRGDLGTAVLYHLIHAVMLFVLAERKPLAAGPWWCFLAVLLFFRLALPAGCDQRPLAGRHHPGWWSESSGRMALAGDYRRQRQQLNAPGKSIFSSVVHGFPDGLN